MNKNLQTFLIFVVFLVLMIKFAPSDRTSSTKVYSPGVKIVSNSLNPPSFRGLEGIKIGINPISQDVVEYLQGSSEYGNYYSQNKKIVAYYSGVGCPYAQTFEDAINSIVNNSEYQQYYNFVARDDASGKSFVVTGVSPDQPNQAAIQAKKYDKFRTLCHEFCIINPSANEVFYIDGIGDTEAAKISTVFDNLKIW